MHTKIEKEHEEEAKADRPEDGFRKLVTRVKAEGRRNATVWSSSGTIRTRRSSATPENRKCDLIMMASHGRKGLNAVLLGSETVKVLTHSKIPVLVVR